MAKKLFDPQDAPVAKFATFYCTIGDRRYEMLNAKNFEAKANVETADVPRLGSVIKGKKAVGLEVKLSFTVYKVSEMFDELIEQFKNNGYMPEFECQVTNEDPATSIGRSTKTYHNCVIDGEVLLSMFDADGDFIEQDIEAYALDFERPEKYTEPLYM
nr:MAG TPA: tail tube protein [Bacteriophage sp.]